MQLSEAEMRLGPKSLDILVLLLYISCLKVNLYLQITEALY